MHGLPDPSHFSIPPQVEEKRRGLAAIDPRIRRALELLQETHTVRVGEIASSLNISDSRFRHLFKKEFGMSPRRYVRLAQLERAKDLLQSSFLRVKEIAALVSANDISHFVRDYKVLYGQTPSQTRKLSGRPRGIPEDSRPGQ
jgi:AraC family transcriptional regulator, arabinose operon regulatory protein